MHPNFLTQAKDIHSLVLNSPHADVLHALSVRVQELEAQIQDPNRSFEGSG